MSRARLGWALLALILALMLPIGAFAEAGLTDGPEMVVEMGYHGSLIYMRDMPMQITVTAGSTNVDAVVTVDMNQSNTQFDRYEYPISLAARATQRIRIPVTVRTRQAEFVVKLVSGDEVLAETVAKPSATLSTRAVLVGALTEDSASLSYMNMSAQSDYNMADELWSVAPLDADSFPSDAGELFSFNIIVVDGYDVRTLSSAQQGALATWIENGGIAIVGGGAGAAMTYPFFEPMTGIKAGALVEATYVAQALADEIGRREQAWSGYLVTPAALAKAGVAQIDLMISDTSGGSPIISGEYPLVYANRVGSGAVMTAAFSIGAKQLGQWSPMHTMWRDLISTAGSTSDAYARRRNQMNDSYYDYNGMTSLSSFIGVTSDRSVTPVIALMLGYLLLVGALSYLVLKKLDKREWMWLTVPVLAIAFAVAVRAMGERLGFSEPIATSVTRIRYSDSGAPSTSMGGTFTSSSMSPIEIYSGSNERISIEDNSRWYYEDPYAAPSQPEKTPTDLRYTYRFGDEPSTVVSNKRAWQVYNYRLTNHIPNPGSARARAWMEEDGLHAEVTNDTPYTLTLGALIGALGYDRMEPIAPGGVGTALLRLPEGAEGGIMPKPSEEAADQSADNSADADAVLPADQDGSAAQPSTVPVSGMLTFSNVDGSYWGYYTMMAAAHPDLVITQDDMMEWADKSPDRELLADVLMEVNNDLGMNINPNYSTLNPRQNMRYVALAEGVPGPDIHLDKRAVKYVQDKAFVDVEVAFEPVGPTGIVYYLPGMIRPWRAHNALPDDLSGYEPAPFVEGQMWEFIGLDYQFETVTINDFVYDLSELSNLELDLLEVSVQASGGAPRLALYNFVTNQWEEQRFLFVRMEGGAAEPYMQKGMLYVRVLPSDMSLSTSGYRGNYATPSVTLRGRLK